MSQHNEEIQALAGHHGFTLGHLQEIGGAELLHILRTYHALKLENTVLREKLEQGQTRARQEADDRPDYRGYKKGDTRNKGPQHPDSTRRAVDLSHVPPVSTSKPDEEGGL